MATVTAPTRIALQNILVATDFSGCAESAVKYALGMAHRYGSTLHMVHVLPEMPFVESTDPDPDRIRRSAQQKLANMVASETFRGIRHTETIQQGEVAQVLADLGIAQTIDLIVLGTQGRSGIGKFLLGSVAEETFRSALCPVLTVGPHVTRGAGDTKVQHILYATDFGPESAHGVPYALSLAEENHARLTLLHVAREPGVALPEPVAGSLPVIAPNAEVANGERQLRALVPRDIALWHEPEYLVQFGPPAETILAAAAQDVDMIVLGVKRPAALTKHLGGGVAYRVVCEAPCPVLTVGARVRT
ncbi:MAG: universal stress protein [Terriglobales bacterium]|jgi:nucleotide-binding universal stress UspA family protein